MAENFGHWCVCMRHPIKQRVLGRDLVGNFQAAIWRRSLVNSPETPNSSQGHGWTTTEYGSLVINSPSTSQFAVVQMLSGLSVERLHMHR